MSGYALNEPAADPATVFGPLSSRDTADQLARRVDDAVAKGAAASTGRRRIPGRGACSESTVLTGITPRVCAYTRSNKKQIRSPR